MLVISTESHALVWTTSSPLLAVVTGLAAVSGYPSRRIPIRDGHALGYPESAWAIDYLSPQGDYSTPLEDYLSLLSPSSPLIIPSSPLSDPLSRIDFSRSYALVWRVVIALYLAFVLGFSVLSRVRKSLVTHWFGVRLRGVHRQTGNIVHVAGVSCLLWHTCGALRVVCAICFRQHIVELTRNDEAAREALAPPRSFVNPHR